MACSIVAVCQKMMIGDKLDIKDVLLDQWSTYQMIRHNLDKDEIILVNTKGLRQVRVLNDILLIDTTNSRVHAWRWHAHHCCTSMIKTWMMTICQEAVKNRRQDDEHVFMDIANGMISSRYMYDALASMYADWLLIKMRFLPEPVEDINAFLVSEMCNDIRQVTRELCLERT
jgi:hypothetical protein